MSRVCGNDEDTLPSLRQLDRQAATAHKRFGKMRREEAALVVGFVAGDTRSGHGDLGPSRTLRAKYGSQWDPSILNPCRDHRPTLAFGMDWCAIFS